MLSSIIVTPQHRTTLILLLTAIISSAVPATAQPPFHGTIFLEKAIILPDDPTAFKTLTSMGSDERRMFDRRAEGWVRADAWLFDAQFSDGQTMEVQVNAEFDQLEAQRQAERYLPAIGQLPYVLREHVRTVTIHRGNKPFGGGNDNLLIHTEMGERYIRSGILEETLCHEAAHTSLDAVHARADRWIAAQNLDKQFISTYARDNPRREDIAESYLLYLALRHKPDRISTELKETIQQTIPHRIEYLDSIQWNLYPFVIISDTVAQPLD